VEDRIAGDGEGNEFVCDCGPVDCADIILNGSLGLCRDASRNVAVLPSEKERGFGTFLQEKPIPEE
jgi:hypothetical protein